MFQKSAKCQHINEGVECALQMLVMSSRREILHFEITGSLKNGRVLFILVPSVSLPGVGISHFRANLNSHEGNADAAAPQARFKKKNIFLSTRSNVLDDAPLLFTE